MSGEIEVQRRTDHRAADDKIAHKRGEKNSPKRGHQERSTDMNARVDTDRPGCDFNRATGRGQRARSSAVGARRQVPRPPDGADGNSHFSSSRSCRAHERKHLAALNHNPASVQTADDRLMFREFAFQVLSRVRGSCHGAGYTLGHYGDDEVGKAREADDFCGGDDRSARGHSRRGRRPRSGLANIRGGTIGSRQRRRIYPMRRVCRHFRRSRSRDGG